MSDRKNKRTANKKAAGRKRRRVSRDQSIDNFVNAIQTKPGSYSPKVGYLHADGTFSQFTPDGISWLNFDRAVSSCFGSAARRFRGTRVPMGEKFSPIVAIIMVVFEGTKPVWKHRVDIPEDI